LMHVAIADGVREAPLLDSTYFGPVYPEAPPFKNPEVDLFKIGVPVVKVMLPPQSRTPLPKKPSRR
jgi:hypothetical protein